MSSGRLTRGALAFSVLLGLGACTGLPEQNMFGRSFWQSGPLYTKGVNSQAGMGELLRGNMVKAEAEFKKALRKNPKDVHALLGMALMFENRGQLTKAREMYEAVLAIRPTDAEQHIIVKDMKTHPVSEIASVNLALLESGGVLATRGGDVGPIAAQTPFASPSKPVTGAPMGSPMLGRAAAAPLPGGTVPFAAGARPGQITASPPPGMPMLKPADTNIVSRFKTLRALRDQGLITQQEFNTRRQANVGALLPLTMPPSAAGLDRAPPATEVVTSRLRAIGRALQMRAMTVGQHASERTMILDGLMPAAPVMVANPTPPPKGLMEAADGVRRLEVLRDGGYITSDEYTKERASIEKIMQPGGKPASAKPMASSSKGGGGPKPALHLASFRSKAKARKGWSELQGKYRGIIRGMSASIDSVNLGRGKGTYYRVKVGPVASKSEAVKLCKKVKRKGGYCEPSIATF